MGYKIKRIYVGTQQVRPAGWTPGADTLLYMPFKTDLLDHSGNGVSFTNSGGVTIQNGAAYFTGSNYLYSKSFNSISSYQTNCTISVWFKNTSSTNAERTAVHQFYYNGSYMGYSLGCKSDGKIMVQNTYTGSVGGTQPSYGTTQRWNVVLVRDNPSKIYINGVFYQNQSSSSNLPNLYSWIGIGGSAWYNSSLGEYKWIGYISDVIIESKRWTAQEVSAYYNQTKSNYGL